MKTENQIRSRIKWLEGLEELAIEHNAGLTKIRYQGEQDGLKWVLGEKEDD